MPFADGRKAVDHAGDGETYRNLEEKPMTGTPSNSRISRYSRKSSFVTHTEPDPTTDKPDDSIFRTTAYDTSSGTLARAAVSHSRCFHV
jgi:hypothetical protein